MHLNYKYMPQVCKPYCIIYSQREDVHDENESLPRKFIWKQVQLPRHLLARLANKTCITQASQTQMRLKLTEIASGQDFTK